MKKELFSCSPSLRFAALGSDCALRLTAKGLFASSLFVTMLGACGDTSNPAGASSSSSSGGSSGVTVPASCTNGVQDTDESGVDCGGAKCLKCVGDACAKSPECASKACGTGTCKPAGTKVCGVGFDRKCDNDEPCATRGDCSSDYCRAADHVCAAPGSDSHSNGVADDGETDADCGGVIAATNPCKTGQVCATNDDCEGLCDASTKKCLAPTHTDGKKNGPDETDIDCGYAAKPCAPGQKCATDDNCEGVCTTNVCAVPGHADMKKNVGESDVDCGGTVADGTGQARRCTTNEACLVSSDCEGLCDNTTKKCLAPTLTDQKKNGTETDIDCGGGGTGAPRCVAGQKCDPAQGARDCDSRFCLAGGTCDTIKAGRKDGNETDVDCGGSPSLHIGANGRWDGTYNAATPRCSDLTNPPQACAIDGDCSSGYCNVVDKVCVSGRSCTASFDDPVVGDGKSGLDTCGIGEVTDATPQHQSCCRTLAVNATTKLDKYEVTTGRMRQFVEYVKTQYAGAPNIRAWAAAEIAANSATGTRLKNQLRQSFTKGGVTTNYNYDAYLPADLAGGLGLMWQLGGSSLDGTRPSDFQGCFTGAGSYGHSTYWFSPTELHSVLGPAFPERPFAKARYDEKSLNCMTYFMAAAFCAWDGGQLPTLGLIQTVWPGSLPWGSGYAAGASTTGLIPVNPRQTAGTIIPYTSTINNFNGDNGNPTHFFYHFPDYGFDLDTTGLIAAPGRFHRDLTTLRSSNAAQTEADPVTGAGTRAEGWQDIAANMMELTQYIAEDPAPAAYPNSSRDYDHWFCDQTVGTGGTPDSKCDDGAAKPGVYRGQTSRAYWYGGSWEVHGIGRPTFAFPLHTQYGKTGFRCMR